jgi:hypothetical protein
MNPLLRVSVGWGLLAAGITAVMLSKSSGPVVMFFCFLGWAYLRFIMKPKLSDPSPTPSLFRALSLYIVVTAAGLGFYYFRKDPTVRLACTGALACALLFTVWDDFRIARKLIALKSEHEAAN